MPTPRKELSIHSSVVQVVQEKRTKLSVSRPWQTRTHSFVADTLLLMSVASKRGVASLEFVSATNATRASIRGNIRVRNNRVIYTTEAAN